MTQPVLESRPLYGIGTVARLTGLKPDTLRVWERRYGLGASHKSGSGRRQYTQADLEHLQLIAALVRNGARIGEIAAAERKTLEMLLRQRDRRPDESLPQPKARVLFLGARLCEWLDDHQGCLASVDAVLLRTAPVDAPADLAEQVGSLDGLVIEAAGLGARQFQAITALRDALDVQNTLVLHEFANERWLNALTQASVTTSSFPPEASALAFELSRIAADKVSRSGDSDLGELMQAKPRQFSELELSAARRVSGALNCECPRHITDLIRSLEHFETYSASCSVENWHDAAVHACIYAYTSQARWLMEKALQAVLEQHESEFRELLEGVGHPAEMAGAA